MLMWPDAFEDWYGRLRHSLEAAGAELARLVDPRYGPSTSNGKSGPERTATRPDSSTASIGLR